MIPETRTGVIEAAQDGDVVSFLWSGGRFGRRLIETFGTEAARSTGDVLYFTAPRASDTPAG